jgi:hypothetical protein
MFSDTDDAAPPNLLGAGCRRLRTFRKLSDGLDCPPDLGEQSLNDGADGGIKLIGKTYHSVSTITLGLLFRIDLTRPQRLGFLQFFAELNKGTAQPADLRLAVVVCYFGIEAPAAKSLRRADGRIQRTSDGPTKQHGKDQTQRKTSYDGARDPCARRMKIALISSMKMPVVMTQFQCLSIALRKSFGASFVSEPERRP